MIRWILLYPFRLIGSAIYWARFRTGGAVRARMESIELDNRQLWAQLFDVNSRLQAIENKEAERNQAVLIERVLDRFPTKG